MKWNFVRLISRNQKLSCYVCIGSINESACTESRATSYTAEHKTVESFMYRLAETHTTIGSIVVFGTK